MFLRLLGGAHTNILSGGPEFLATALHRPTEIDTKNFSPSGPIRGKGVGCEDSKPNYFSLFNVEMFIQTMSINTALRWIIKGHNAEY